MLKGLKGTKHTWAQKKRYYLTLFKHRTSCVRNKKLFSEETERLGGKNVKQIKLQEVEKTPWPIEWPSMIRFLSRNTYIGVLFSYFWSSSPPPLMAPKWWLNFKYLQNLHFNSYTKPRHKPYHKFWHKPNPACRSVIETFETNISHKI